MLELSINTTSWWLSLTIPMILLMFALIAIIYLVGEFLTTRCNPITRVMGIYFIRIVVYILTFNAIGYYYPNIGQNLMTNIICFLIVLVITLDTIAINWVLFRNIKAHMRQLKLNPKESRMMIYRICLTEKNFIKAFYQKKIMKFYRKITVGIFGIIGVLSLLKLIIYWNATYIDQNIILFFVIIAFSKYYTFKCVDKLR